MMCIVCKKGSMLPTTIAHRVEVAGHTFTAMLPGARCNACGEGQTRGQDLEAFELAVARLLMSAAPSAEAFRFTRKALGYSGKVLGGLLGTTLETISRWETGRHPIDRQAWALVGLLAQDKLKTEAALKDAAEPRPLAAEVAVTV